MKAKLLLLPLLIATAVNADILAPTEDSANYADKRLRYTAKLQEAPKPVPQKLASSDASAGKFDISAQVATPHPDGMGQEAVEAEKKRVGMPLREIDDTFTLSFREKSLPSAIRSLTPPGWVVDLQFDKSLYQNRVGFSGEITTYGQALKDILEPQGLTFLAYRNMKPKPLLVVTHGGKK